MKKDTQAPFPTPDTKKNKRNRIILIAVSILAIAILAVTVLFLAFREDAAVMTVGDAALTEEMYVYLFSSCKYDFLASYKTEGLSDTEASWKSALPKDQGNGMTWETLFNRHFEAYLSRLLTGAMLYDRDYSLTVGDKAALDASINTLVADLGGQSQAEKTLADYGTSLSAVRRVLALKRKAELYFTETYGKNGELVDADILEARYQKDYARIKTVFVRTKGKIIGEDENGNPVHDYMSEADLLAAEGKISILQSKLTLSEAISEETFNSLQQYNEDESAKNFIGGYYLSKDSYYDTAVIDAALSMRVGECRLVRGEYGAFLIYRYENPKGAYLLTDNRTWFEGFTLKIAKELYEEELKKHTADIWRDTAALAPYTVTTVKQSYEIIAN